MRKRVLLLGTLLCGNAATAIAAEESAYTPSRVVYDVATPDAAELGRILDRASLLQNLYGNDPLSASVVVVLHEGAIPLFAKSGQRQVPELLQRADSLAQGEVVQFRVCAASARMQGFGEEDFAEFVTLVPMADAEIVRLQNAGYAYLR